MANKSFFLCFLATLSLLIGQTAFAFNAPPVYYEQPETCNAPAPTNFRITERSANFIVLAWDPAWSGATHTLAILESDGQGGWIGVDTLHQVSGGSYTAGGLTPGQTYRFVIATNCQDGSPSTIKLIIEGSSLIVDLTIGGRSPRFPVNSQLPCTEIPLNAAWKGFQVSKIGADGLFSNDFEFIMNSQTSYSFRRVGLYKPVVAENKFTQWPICPMPIVDLFGENDFKIVRLPNGGQEKEVIGIVQYSISSLHLSVCPIYDHPTFPWKNDYEFSALISGNVGPAQSCNGFNGDPTEEKNITLVNAAPESIEIRFRGYENTSPKGIMRIFYTGGQLLQTLPFELPVGDDLVSINFARLMPSVYFVTVEIGGHHEIHKICIIH